MQEKCYCRKQKNSKFFHSRMLISYINKHTGGVVIHDNSIANSRIRIKGSGGGLLINMRANLWKIYVHNIENESKVYQIQFPSQLALAFLRLSIEALDVLMLQIQA
ncbi:hypothetical protein NPIL_240381 [Nephila pilipes]|uniref:Uncharacterized protein n=1 Tax=Nephila pilipes TaxID=299642 RepID=A0A8X6KHB0_NEPPI|nr:hypothetical protein NPIL_240381 [Nephila pilipes]